MKSLGEVRVELRRMEVKWELTSGDWEWRSNRWNPEKNAIL